MEALKVRVEPQKLFAEVKKILGEKEKEGPVRSEVPAGRGDSKEGARGVEIGGMGGRQQGRESQGAWGGSGRDGKRRREKENYYHMGARQSIKLRSSYPGSCSSNDSEWGRGGKMEKTTN